MSGDKGINTADVDNSRAKSGHKGRQKDSWTTSKQAVTRIGASHHYLCPARCIWAFLKIMGEQMHACMQWDQSRDFSGFGAGLERAGLYVTYV